METLNAMSLRSIQYYVISHKWSSDLNFYKIETAFFHRLIEDHFIRLSAPENIDALKSAGKKLLYLEVEISNADRLLSDQIKQIELMTEDVLIEDAETLAVTQIKLEKIIGDITRQFREVKINLFDLVKRVVKDKNIQLYQ
ncbi:MAG: hypothetical protein ACTHNW_09010 [Mucilaginibacter sp.]